MIRAVSITALIFLTSACGAATTATRGVLVMAHGGDAAWNANVEEAVAPVREKWPVEIAYGMAVSSSLESAVARLEARGVSRIAVVRLFVSGDSWIEETEYIFGLRKELAREKIEAHAKMGHHAGHAGGHAMEAPRPISKRSEIALSRRGVADSTLIDAILADRARELSRNPTEETVLILAHGPGGDEENARWLENMNARLDAIRAIGPFRSVEVATLREDWPEKRKVAEEDIRERVRRGLEKGGRVLVLPFRISGFGPYAKVLEGLEYTADGRGFLPHPNMTRWIEETARELFAAGDGDTLD